jgi:hypothetical protein
MARGTRLILLVLALVATTSASAADKKCTIAVKGDNAVVKACQNGGLKAAKAVMKKMVATAKDKGKKFTCESCHKNDVDFKLNADADKRFKELLSVQ